MNCVRFCFSAVCALPSPPAATQWSRLLLTGVICSECVTVHFEWGGNMSLWPWPLTFILVQARDQTRLSREFGANHTQTKNYRLKMSNQNINRMQAAEITPGSDGMVPSAAAWRYLHRACSIPSLPGGDGSAQRVFVPGDLDLWHSNSSKRGT